MTRGTPIPLLSAENINVILDGHHILDNVSLDMYPRDFVTIVGPNGAGKTMLIKVMLEFQTPNNGTIKRDPKTRIGYVPEKITADISLPLRVIDFLRLRIKSNPEALNALIEHTKVTPIIHKMLYALSGGEWQRVLLARALVDQPNLLILDEPTRNLDMNGQIEFYQLLEEIYQSREIAILLVSHDLHLVMASTRQVVCLYHHICCSGSPQTVARDPNFLNIFGDEIARMVSVYAHNHDHAHNPVAETKNTS